MIRINTEIKTWGHKKLRFELWEMRLGNALNRMYVIKLIWFKFAFITLHTKEPKEGTQEDQMEYKFLECPYPSIEYLEKCLKDFEQSINAYEQTRRDKGIR